MILPFPLQSVPELISIFLHVSVQSARLLLLKKFSSPLFLQDHLCCPHCLCTCAGGLEALFCPVVYFLSLYQDHTPHWLPFQNFPASLETAGQTLPLFFLQDRWLIHGSSPFRVYFTFSLSRYPDINSVRIFIWIKLKLCMNLGVMDIFVFQT